MAVRKSGKRSSRDKLLTAAATLMRESGYAAVTSRRLAAKAGLKPQLVHYYFRTMDDLFLALFEEVSAGLVERQNAVLKSKKPLRELWKMIADPKNMTLAYEFVALANHRKVVRAEITTVLDKIRQGQIEIVTQVLAQKGIKEFPWTPAFTTVLFNCLARGVALDNSLGVKRGHTEALATIDHYLTQLE
jgi:AcrR family transcriptional regulator